MSLIRAITLLAASLLCSPAWAQFGPQPNAPEGSLFQGQFGGLDDAETPDVIPPYESQSLLNVEANLHGTAIAKRQGYSLYYTGAFSTATVKGTAFFRNANGDEILVVCYDVYCDASKNGGAFSHVVTTATVGTTRWSFVNSLGALYGANDSHDNVFKYDGTNLTYPANIPAGTILALTRDRLIVADTTANPGTANYSKSGDFTTFAAGVNTTDPWSDVIEADGDRITGAWYDSGTLYYWKYQSIVGCEYGDQYTTRCVPVSSKIGTKDPTSIVSTPDGIYFAGSDNYIWLLKNYQLIRVSSQIPNLLKSRASGKVANNTTNTQAAWQAGTQAPTNSWNTTTISGSIFPSSMTAVDSTYANLSAGTTASTTVTVSSTVVSVQNSTGVFINIGAESGGDSQSGATNWTFDCGTLSQPCMASRTTVHNWGNDSWSEAGLNWQGIPATINIKDASNNILLSTTVSPVAGSWVTSTINTSTLAVAQIKINMSVTLGGQIGGHGFSGVVTMTSVPFIRPNQVVLAFDSFNTGGTNTQVFAMDADESITLVTTGTFTSQCFDTTFSTPTYGPFTVGISSDSNQSITFQTLVSTSCSGTFDAPVSVTPGNKITSAQKEFIEYKGTWGAIASSTNTPASLSSATILAATTGQFTSQCINTTNNTSFGLFSCSQSLLGNGSLTYGTRTAATCGALSGSFTAQTNNTNVAASANNATQFQMTSLLGSATDQAQVNSCTIYWNSGALSPPSWSAYDSLKNAAYWTWAINNSTTTNRWLKFDMNIREWFPFDIQGTAPIIGSGNTLYFGSALGLGQVYQYGSINNDNGAAINSFWQSKDFGTSNPFVEHMWNAVSLIAKNQGSGTLNVTYTNGSNTTNTYNVSLSTTSGIPYIRSNYASVKMTPSNFMSLKVGNNAADQPWEVDGFGLYYVDRPWRVLGP